MMSNGSFWFLVAVMEKWPKQNEKKNTRTFLNGWIHRIEVYHVESMCIHVLCMYIVQHRYYLENFVHGFAVVWNDVRFPCNYLIFVWLLCEKPKFYMVAIVNCQYWTLRYQICKKKSKNHYILILYPLIQQGNHVKIENYLENVFFSLCYVLSVDFKFNANQSNGADFKVAS